MHPRSYALTLAAVGAGTFLAVVGTNLILDPEAVFGTDLFVRSPNFNDRYRHLVLYQTEADRFDGLLFGSSRAKVIPTAELSPRMGGVQFADFAVNAGALADHLPVLEYVLKHKAARREALRAVFLILDIDTLGHPPWTNRFIQTLLPPALTGESATRFWWRNATAIQVKAWKSSIKAALGWTLPDEAPDLTRASRSIATELVAMVSAAPARAQVQAAAGLPATAEFEPIVDSAYFIPHLELLRRLVTICRERGIALLVATTPIHPARAARFAPGEIGRAIARVSRIVPVWDFTDPPGQLQRPDQWRDIAHFTPQVGQMMVQRMLGEPMPAEAEDFGRLRQP